MLRSTGQAVRLKLIRYVRGLKFEQLQQAIANSQANNSPRIQHDPTPQMIRTDSVMSEEEASVKEEEQEQPLKLNFEGTLVKKSL